MHMSDMREQARTTPATQAPQQRGRPAAPGPSAWAGWVLFGAMMMVLLGAFQAIAGLVALFDDRYYLVGANGLVVHVDYTAWGWTHLIVGLVALAAGFGLFTGAMWARVLGIGVAVISAIVNFAFIAAFPFWALTMIVLDVLIIYAVAAHGRELQDQS
jgi:hypothetical protein